MLPLTGFGMFVMVLCLLPISSVYGHGLGIDTIPIIDVQGKDISVSVEMPMYLENNSEQITITATEKETRENAENVTFLIGLFYDEQMIFRNYFFTDNGVLPIKISQRESGDLVIHGEQNSILGAWHGTESDPVEITGPIFNSGGLYTFEIEVRTIDKPTNIIEDSGIYNVDLSIIDTASHTQKDAKDHDVEFRSKSYFDKISNFEYDSETKQVTFEMPFDWSEKQVSHIPVVHAEVHFPKDFAEFLTPGYSGSANGVDLFKSSVTIDDYTKDDERIVHFVLLQDHLRFLKNEMKKSGEPLPDNIVFTLFTGKDLDLPLIAYTKSEDYEVNLSWDPVVIEPGISTNFVFTIRDGQTREPLRNSEYTFVILQNGDEIHRTTGTAQIGGYFEKFTFAEEHTGHVTIKLENIRNTGQETEFVIVVAPEFGTVMLILGIALVGIIIFGAKYGPLTHT